MHAIKGECSTKKKPAPETMFRERANSVTMAAINVQHKSIIRKLFFRKFHLNPVILVRIGKPHPNEGVTPFVYYKHI